MKQNQNIKLKNVVAPDNLPPLALPKYSASVLVLLLVDGLLLRWYAAINFSKRRRPLGPLLPCFDKFLFLFSFFFTVVTENTDPTKSAADRLYKNVRTANVDIL